MSQQISLAAIVAELKRMVSDGSGDALVFKDGGVRSARSEDLAGDAASPIADISLTSAGTVMIRFHDKAAALAELAKLDAAPRETGQDHLANLARRYAGDRKQRGE